MSAKATIQTLRKGPRRTISAPELVAQFIDAVNAFPSDWIPQTKILELAKDLSMARREELLSPIFVELLDSAPAPVQKIFGSVHGRRAEAEPLYRFVEQVRDMLHEIADLNESKMPGDRELTVRLPEVVYMEEGTGHMKTWSAFPNLFHDDKNDESVQIDWRRVRRCRICRKLFWAGRSDKVCCTEKCGRVLRAREWRKGH